LNEAGFKVQLQDKALVLVDLDPLDVAFRKEIVSISCKKMSLFSNLTIISRQFFMFKQIHNTLLKYDGI